MPRPVPRLFSILCLLSSARNLLYCCGLNSDDAVIGIRLTMPRDPLNFPNPKFPPHPDPRVWFITSAPSPIGISLSRQLLAHGDFLILGTSPGELSIPGCSRGEDFEAFWCKEIRVKEGWRKRVKVVELDGRCEESISSTDSPQADGLTRTDMR